jgi:glycosyltransferase 2 family protein
LNWKLWVGVLISGALLWFAIRDVEFAKVWANIQGINYPYILPYLGLVVIEVVLRAWKWHVLLTPVKVPSFWKLNSATIIGLMANNVLPGRAGEFVRAYAGARLERISFSASFATVVIDRVLDGLTVSAIFVAALILQPSLPDAVKVPGYAAAGLYVVAIAFLVVLLVQETFAFRWLAWVLRAFPEGIGHYVTGLLQAFVHGLGALKNGRLLSMSIFISVLIWLGYALSVWVMALAMDIRTPEGPLTVLQAFVVLLIVTILLTLPSTPGFVGAMEFGIKSGLVLFGVDENQALAFALVYHVTQYVPITIGGFVALWLEGLSMSEISHAPTPDAAADPA